MKVNELMIGDCVLVGDNDKYSGTYAQIISLQCHKPEDGVYFSVFVCCDKGLYTTEIFSENDINPIPLTKEILEKNGFKYHDEETGACGVKLSPYYVYENSPRIYCDGQPFAVWFENEVNIKYVHELQHLLKFCRIEKEIIL